MSRDFVTDVVNNYLSIELLLPIKDCLIQFNQKKFWKLIHTVPRPYIYNKFKNELSIEFENYIRLCAKNYPDTSTNFSYLTFTSYCLTGKVEIDYARHIANHVKNLPIIRNVYIELKTELNNKIPPINYDSDIWVIVSSEKLNTKSKDTLLFNESLPLNIKVELKNYVQYRLKNHISISDIQNSLRNIQLLLSILKSFNYPNINFLEDINHHHVIHLFNHIQSLKKKDGSNYYSLGTIRRQFTYCRILFDWYINENQLTIDNAFRSFKFHNAKSFTKNKNQYIPESIIQQLNNHLHLTPDYVQNIWTILMHTGMRISEALNLTADDLIYIPKSKSYELTYLIKKTRNKRLLHNLDEKHRIPVNDLVANAMKNQITSSENLRKMANTALIFITYRQLGYRVIKACTIKDHINKIIKDKNICLEDGTLFHYKNHMCRKTVIVELLKNGANLESIADYIGHLSTETTRQHYGDLDREHQAKLDSAMFEKLFEETLEDKVKLQFSPPEKIALIEEIKAGVRETPEGHGYCTKHVSFGPCQKRSCVGCKMLITGPQKLPMWYKLRKEQEEYLNQLKNEYLRNNIENYKEHRLYQQEIRLLNIYKDTIKKVENFARKEGIHFNND